MCSNINDLPDEIIVSIFSYCLENVTQAKLLDNAGRVCRKWRRLCYENSLWTHFDGSVNFNTLKRLCKRNVLINTETFRFSKVNCPLQVECLKKIYSSLPNLKCLNLSNLYSKGDKFKVDFYFTALKSLCPSLCSIIVNESSVELYSVVPQKFMVDLITERGLKIKVINVSFIALTGSYNIFNIIAENCPNLEELISEGLHRQSSQLVFPIKVVQHYCQKLKVLRLGYPLQYRKDSRNKVEALGSSGFPDLETFTHPDADNLTFGDLELKMLLAKSPKLKELDLRGCNLISFKALSELPFMNLEKLLISKARLIYSDQFCNLISGLSHSLRVLDISKTSGDSINNMLKALIPATGTSKMEELDTNNTLVTIDTVKLLLLSCPHLKYLNLESCRGLGRGLKAKYQGRDHILKLLSILEDRQL